MFIMAISVRLRDGRGYSIDSYEIDGVLIELKKTSRTGKSQITTLPIDDILELQFPMLRPLGPKALKAISA